jgi:hypothetical protein
MRNLDITDTRDKLFVYAKSGMLGTGLVESLHLPEPAKDGSEE